MSYPWKKCAKAGVVGVFVLSALPLSWAAGKPPLSDWGDVGFRVVKTAPSGYVYKPRDGTIQEALKQAFQALTAGIPESETTLEGQRKFAEARWDDYVTNLSDFDRDTVRRYTEQDWYEGFSRTVRANVPRGFLSENFTRRDDALYKVLHQRSADRDYVVSRYASLSAFTDSEIKKLAGTTMQDPGYLSTSLGGQGTQEWDVQKSRVDFRLRLPEGTAVASIQKISHYPVEEEMLLPRGTEIQITDVICAIPDAGKKKSWDGWKEEWGCGHWEIFGKVAAPFPQPGPTSSR
ncbi:ADP-ribosyltransferase [Burkholderia multivorans]|uniref:ADP-ribosyltransferase n=1 Tax=Burkholderia multivorans TaxID=87883 RepID=UPI001C2573F6|nr:ADP-ribosyltransferase [Burkholderia multivorans]MBU9337264.1 ADP-ribosyltransferase [Burkholderia multivorans]MCA8480147.1 ADP-ribosyltransferase [Burkholderia multivorans]